MSGSVTHKAMTSADEEVGIIIRQMRQSVESETVNSQ
jgi:hypothetical protein